MRGILVFVVLGCLAGVAACATATGDVVGGQYREGFDPATPVAPPAPPGPPPPPEPDLTNAAPNTWRGIYRDYFAPTATSGCNRGGCHNKAGAGGVLLSNFLCASVDDCYRSLRTDKHPGEKVALVDDAALANPDTAFIFRVIRLQTPAGVQQNLSMPLTPSDFVFSVADVERLKTWIRAGARNE